MAPGSFNVSLSLESTPNSIINAMVPWGQIVLTPTRINPDEFTDAQIRNLARYVGIVQTQEIGEEGIEIAGKGILTYLGDSDSRGMVLARDAGVGAVRAYQNDTLADVIDRSSSTPYGILRDESANQRAVRKGTVTEVSFDDTVLLLNFEGSNGDTSTTDGSAFTSNQVITFQGTADISTDQAKYGSTSLHLTTDGYVLVADRPELDLTYQEFTVEWWEYRTSDSGNPTVIARNDDTYSPWIFGKAVSGNNKAFITHDGDGYNETEDLNIDMGSIDLNQWNHFAISHKGDQFKTFKNGVIVTTVDKPELFVRVSSDSLQIGRGQGGNYFEGYIDGLAITRGTAKYWDAFTPSTSAPTATTANKKYTGSHYLESAYKAIKTISTSVGSEFKMNNDGTIDVGPASALFTGHESNEPEAIIVRRLSGQDPSIKGYEGFDLTTEFNAEDYVSRVELIASNYGKDVNLGQADAKDTPYKDLHGNTLERIQILSENDIPDTMRDIRAEAYLNEYNKIDRTLNVGLADYDISGDVNVGDIIYVYDPEVGFEDTATDAALENRDKFEVTYQGQILNPVKIRIMGLSFPIATGMGVYYRDKDGNYTDVTDYTNFEVGSTQIEVGSTTRNINEDLRGSASVIGVAASNEFTVPDAPTAFTAAVGTYQDGSGRPFAFANLSWTEPTNTNGSRITDGNMYRVRYRQVTDVDGNNLIDSADNQVTDYEYLTVEFGTTAVVIKGLGPNNTYEFGVACIDNSGFSGGFAVITAQQMPTDSTVPPQPTPPENTFGSIASNAARVQITHKLGAAKTVDGDVISSPTNFTLPRDIDHLNVYRGTTSSFTISASNFVGEIQARAGHIDGNITAVQSFDISTAGGAYYRVTAVDVAGNESDPSTAVQVTEELIGTQYIEDAAITTIKVGEAQITDAKIDTLTASKITAGTISGKEIIIDTDSATDPSNPVLGTIRSSGYVADNAGWIIKSDGSVEFESGKFRGDITGASGTFSGNLSAAGGTFTGNLNASQINAGTFSADIISGGTIDGSSINLGSGTFTVDTNGAMVASSATITGNINANAGTIGGTSINANTLEGSFDANNSTGYQLTSNAATFHDVTITGTLSGATIDGVVSGTLATANSGQRIEFSNNGSAIMQFFSNSGQSGYVADVSGDLTLQAEANSALVLSGGTNGIKWSGAAYFEDGGSYSNTTNTNKVIRATANGKPYWGNVPASAGVTALQESSNVLSLSGNTGSITIGDNHTSNHHASSDHTGNGNTNLATLAYVNSRGFTSNNGNSNLGTHGNADHNDLGFGTGNSNINASSVNSLISGHIKVNTGYNHAASVHNNGNGNGNMNSTNHYNSSIAFNTHMHPNAIIHDSRLLNINANNVPGINFVNRLNPVQSNYVSSVETRLSTKEQMSGFISDHIEATAFTLTAQDIKQALTDDGYTGDYALYLPNVDYLTDEHGSDIGEGEEVQGFSDEHLVPVLVQAIKDLSAKIDTLEDRITTLEG